MEKFRSTAMATPPSGINAIKFTVAMNPEKVSASDHTKGTDPMAPPNTHSATTARKMFRYMRFLVRNSIFASP